MTTKELISDIAASSGMNKAEVARLLAETTDVLTETLLEGTPVHIQDFGDFCLKEKKERITVHPRTGVKTLTPAKRQITFTQTKSLKANLKDQ